MAATADDVGTVPEADDEALGASAGADTMVADPQDGQDDLEADERKARASNRIVRVLSVASLVFSAVSIGSSLVVVAMLREGLSVAGADHAALLGKVNPWYAASIGGFLAALALLVVSGVLGLKRLPTAERGPGAVPAGVGLAFAALAWAFSLYRRLG